MQISETTKETSIPIARIITSFDEKLLSVRNFAILRKLTPNIVGIAIKKLNSAAAGRATPMIRAPIMVAPEREVPGTMARSWKKPIISAVL